MSLYRIKNLSAGLRSFVAAGVTVQLYGGEITDQPVELADDEVAALRNARGHVNGEQRHEFEITAEGEAPAGAPVAEPAKPAAGPVAPSAGAPPPATTPSAANVPEAAPSPVSAPSGRATR